jgi:O-antigen ligase
MEQSVAVETTPITVSALPRQNWRVQEWLFVAFLLLALVGLEPFKARDPLALVQVAEGEGSSLRQIAYLGVFLALALLAITQRGLAGLMSIPLPVVLMLGWMVASSLWSLAPDITLRRAGLTTVAVWSVFMSVHTLGVERAFQVFYTVLAVILVVNLVSVVLIAEAVHLPGDVEAGLIGNWRGLHFHKNIAGPIAALSALVFFHLAAEYKHWGLRLLFLGSIIFVIGAGSKTTFVLLPLALMVAAFTRWAQKNPVRRQGFLLTTTISIVLGILMLLAFWDSLIDFVSDPAALTGRGEIWRIVSHFIMEQPWIGYGYGAFWQIGVDSPALHLAMGWAGRAAHSHNGFLEIWVTTGLIGLLVALVAAIILPMLRVLSLRGYRPDLLFSLLFFSILLNTTETRIFQGAREEWVMHLVTIALIYLSPRQETPNV